MRQLFAIAQSFHKQIMIQRTLLKQSRTLASSTRLASKACFRPEIQQFRAPGFAGSRYIARLYSTDAETPKTEASKEGESKEAATEGDPIKKELEAKTKEAKENKVNRHFLQCHFYGFPLISRLTQLS